MQYSLTAAELQDLQTAGLKVDKEAQGTIQKLCTKVCDTMYIHGWHAELREERVNIDGKWAAPWGCILTEGMECCDKCPVQAICPNQHKRWSK